MSNQSTREQKRRLNAMSTETGLSLSDLIRQACGAWRGRDFDGEGYVEQLRRR